jgi:glycosyltransferase involved in cell wall biosynthesis
MPFSLSRISFGTNLSRLRTNIKTSIIKQQITTDKNEKLVRDIIMEAVPTCWSTRYAKQILKLSNDFEMECWFFERLIKKPITFEDDKITYKVFPSNSFKYVREVSLQMVQEMNAQRKEGDVLIHLQHLHMLNNYLISYIFKNLPIIAQHSGELPPLYRISVSGNVVMFPIYFMEQLIEPQILGNIDHFFVTTKYEKKYLSKYVDNRKISIQTSGVDFKLFKPVPKNFARKKLGLPKDKKIILYVSRFIKYKGCDVLIKTFEKLKDKYDVELVLAGGSKNDELYLDAKRAGAVIHEWVPNEKLPMFYSAADVYVFPGSKYCDKWGGIGVAPVESLACGTPVVARSLLHFPSEEWKNVGMIPNNVNEVGKCVSYVLDNPKDFKNCRKIAEKYYSWENISKNIIQVYETLFKKYKMYN